MQTQINDSFIDVAGEICEMKAAVYKITINIATIC